MIDFVYVFAKALKRFSPPAPHVIRFAYILIFCGLSFLLFAITRLFLNHYQHEVTYLVGGQQNAQRSGSLADRVRHYYERFHHKAFPPFSLFSYKKGPHFFPFTSIFFIVFLKHNTL